nr:glucokinase [Acanthamoeba castellanii]
MTSAPPLPISTLVDIIEEARPALLHWKDRFKESLKYFVGVDIGGTNTRVALDTGSSDEPYVQIAKFRASSSKHIVEGLQQVARQVADILGVPASGACLAGAGRIGDDGLSLDITNYPGTPADRTLTSDQLPTYLFPADATHFINDLESTCYGLKSLNESNQLASFFKPLWSTSDTVTMERANYLVLAVGTGLGIALLTSLGRGSRNIPLQVMPMEFGHALYSPVTDPAKKDEEDRLAAYLSKTLYSGKNAIEYEDIVSGRGVLAVYQWITAEHKEAAKYESAEEISAAAFREDPCPFATKALLIHYRFLMRVAKNLCVGLQAKGMFLAGDNQVVNNPFFEKYLAEMRAEFLDHPKPDWIDKVELYTQTQSFNINLHGALYYARTDQR